MFFKKEGMPQDSEIVVCTVTKVHYHSVFVSLNDYSNKSAMLHISEISPGRIRNINDFVKEGKVIVCKVLKIDEKKGHIDVSLRRVNENQRREKVDLIKQEQKSEKIIEFAAKETKQDSKKLYDKVFKVVKKNHSYLHEAFNDLVMDEFDIKTLKLDEKTTKLLDELIRQRIKPPEVTIKAKLNIQCFAPNGVHVVKDVLNSFFKHSNGSLKITYLGGGTQSIFLKGEHYEEIEAPFSKIKEILESHKSKDFEYTLERV